MITPSQTLSPKVKPTWQASVGAMEGIVAHNCRVNNFPRPVLALPMWEGAGPRVFDLSGYQNNGDLVGGPPWRDAGIDLNGTTQYIECGAKSILEVQSHTLCCLVNSDDWTSPNRILFAKSDSIVDSGMEWGIDNDGYMSFAYNDGGIRGWYEDSTALSVGEDLCLCGVWDKTAGEVTFYVDGDEKDTDSTTTGTIQYSSDEAVIGNQSQNEEFDGMVWQVLLFEVVLTPAQIKFLHDDPYFMFRVPEEMYGYTAGAPPPAAIINQFMRSNLGADLFNGALQ